jgi:hypothetical protein
MRVPRLTRAHNTQVAFYPFALQSSQQQEIMRYGEILEKLVTSSYLRAFETEDGAGGNDHSEHVEILTRLRDLQQGAAQQRVDDAVVASATRQIMLNDSMNLTPAAPHGIIIADNATRHDATTGRDYYSLFKSKAVLTKPTVEDDDDRLEGPRVLDRVPSFDGSGVTFTWWHRHPTAQQCLAVDNSRCMVTLLYAHNARGTCWSLSVLPDGIQLENSRGKDFKYQYSEPFMDEHHALNAALMPKWRHLALTLNALDDSASYYVDGILGWKGKWGSAVAAAECAEHKIAFGRKYPAWTNGLEVGIFDMRMYVGEAVPAAKILALADEKVRDLAATDRCGTEQTNADKQWKDELGRNCRWYALHRSVSPTLCELPEPMKYCPVACLVAQPCFEPKTKARHYQLWHTIQSIGRKTSKGTFCIDTETVDSKRTKQHLRGSCDGWVAAGMPAPHKQVWLANYQQAAGRRFDMFNASSVCDEVLASIDDGCEFRRNEITEFTADVRRNGGDFTIMFWVRPSNGDSFMSDGSRFLPHLAFYSSLFPPEHNIVLGAYKSHDGGALRVQSPCRTSEDSPMYESMYTSASSVSGWTRITYIRKNSSKHEDAKYHENILLQNTGAKKQETREPMCLFNEETIFSALEVNYPMYISPIQLYPEAFAVEHVQRMYYAMTEDMAVRSGPVVPYRKQIRVEHIEYTKRSALVAPPIIFQVREHESQCESEFAKEWIQAQRAEAQESFCNKTGYDCHYLTSPISCSTKKSHFAQNETFFGLKVQKIEKYFAFADLLASMASFDRVYRDGKLLLTKNFLDIHTSMLEVEMAFYAPEASLLSLLTIKADISRDEGLKVEYSLDFCNVLEGRKLNEYLVYEGISLFIIFMLLVEDVLMPIVKQHRSKKRVDSDKRLDFDQLEGIEDPMAMVLDFVIASVVTVCVLLRIRSKLQSGAEVKHLVESWAQIEWGNYQADVSDKKDAFFQGVSQFRNDIAQEGTQNAAIFIVLIMCMLRMLQQTKIHPRLALITGTLSFAAGHLMHAFLVAMAVVISFAVVGNWRFGIYLEDFTSIGSSIAKEVSLFYSPETLDGWQNKFELTVFTMLLMFMMTLLVLNFVLAM